LAYDFYKKRLTIIEDYGIINVYQYYSILFIETKFLLEERKMKKFLALTLVAIMLFAALVACGKGDAGDPAGSDTPAASDDTSDTDATSETDKHGQPALKHNVPEDLNYQGLKIGLASRSETRYRREICVETPTDPLDMKIFLRNQEVEKYLNVKLNFIEAPELWGEPSTKITNYVTQEYQAGAESEVDIISANAAYAVNSGMRGYLVDLHGMDATYLEPYQGYWNQSYVEQATCYDQLYYIVGDVSLTIYDKAIVEFVNLDTAKEEGIDSSEFYNHVYNGTWTFDTFYNYVNDYTYIDTNNNFEVDIADDIRISTIFQSEAADGYFFAFDMDVIDTKDDNTHTIKIDGNTKLVSGAEKIASLYSLAGIFHGNTETAFKSFIEGKSFFHTDILYRNENQNKELRNATFAYGILPLPKYDEDQKDYHTSPQDAYNTLAILKTHEDNIEPASAMLEIMASKSYDEVRPFYIEKMVKGEYTADADSVKMIDIVLDGIVFDTGWIFSFEVNRFAYNVWRGPACGTTTVSEAWAKIQTETIDTIRSFDMFYEATGQQ